MTQIEYQALFQRECEEEIALARSKNLDYSDPNDAFANLRTIEDISGGQITLEMGVLTRLTDKFKRSVNLLFRGPEVRTEQLVDTLRDMSVYAKMLRIYMLHEKNRRNPDGKEARHQEGPADVR